METLKTDFGEPENHWGLYIATAAIVLMLIVLMLYYAPRPYSHIEPPMTEKEVEEVIHWMQIIISFTVAAVVAVCLTLPSRSPLPQAREGMRVMGWKWV